VSAPGKTTDLHRVEDGRGAGALVDVARGGTIRSFRTADGWELFARGGPAGDRLALGDPFERSGFTGHVECLPTIAPSTVEGLDPEPLVDHGALWQPPWEVTEEQPGVLGLAIRVVGWPVTVARRLVVSGGQLDLGYTLTNHGAAPLPVLWAGHGLLAAPPGTRVAAPSWGAGRWRVGARSQGLGPAEVQRLLAAVEDPAGLALDDLGVGGYVKAFAPWAEQGAWLLLGDRRVRVRARHPSGRLRIGLWLNNHGIPAARPLRHVALEPSTGDDDDLSACVRRDTCWWVAAGTSTSWSMSYQVR
jgi:hypothetical protein